MKTFRLLMFLPLVLLLAGLTSPAQALTVLASAPVELREVDLSYPAEAVVESVKQVTIAAQTTGRVVEARFDSGARFKSGEVLMRLDAREAQQGLAGAQAQLAQAKAQLERTRSLFAQKFVSQAALDKAEADYKTAAAGAGQAGVADSHANIIAPFAGVIARRLVEVGDMALPGKALLSIFDPQDLRVVANIPQARQGEVRQALRARIEFPETGQWLDATRVEMLPTADEVTHDVRVRAYLPAVTDTVLPGTFVRAHFIIGKGKKLVVPASAILRRGELTGAYVIDAKNENAPPSLRQVRIGEAVASGMLEVLAGLSAGERVALEPVKAGFSARH